MNVERAGGLGRCIQANLASWSWIWDGCAAAHLGQWEFALHSAHTFGKAHTGKMLIRAAVTFFPPLLTMSPFFFHFCLFVGLTEKIDQNAHVCGNAIWPSYQDLASILRRTGPVNSSPCPELHVVYFPHWSHTRDFAWPPVPFTEHVILIRPQRDLCNYISSSSLSQIYHITYDPEGKTSATLTNNWATVRELLKNQE